MKSTLQLLKSVHVELIEYADIVLNSTGSISSPPWAVTSELHSAIRQTDSEGQSCAAGPSRSSARRRLVPYVAVPSVPVSLILCLAYLTIYISFNVSMFVIVVALGPCTSQPKSGARPGQIQHPHFQYHNPHQATYARIHHSRLYIWIYQTTASNGSSTGRRAACPAVFGVCCTWV